MIQNDTFLSAPAGFLQGGRYYCSRDPHLAPNADADLWNKSIHVKAALSGEVTGRYMEPNPTDYSGSERALYLRDSENGTVWGASREIYDLPSDDVAFVAGPHEVVWETRQHGIRTSRALRVPWGEPMEHWTIRLTNESNRHRKLSAFPVFGMGFLGLIDNRATFDEEAGGFVCRLFRYYVKIDDYYPLSKRRNLTYCLPSERPDAWECSHEIFWRKGSIGAPSALKSEKLGCGDAHYEETVAAFQYDLSLEPGEELELRFVLGPAYSREIFPTLRETYLSDDAGSTIAASWEAHEADHRGCYQIETPEADFDSYINYWQPRRTWMIGETLRFNPSPQGRNAIQDAMGAAMVNQDLARGWFLKIWQHQLTEGFLPHGMPMVPGAEIMPISTIPHKDTNVWGPDALAFYMRETGDIGILDEVIPYADSEKVDTLYEHVCHGLQWLLNDRTPRGLSRIGQGDWNDPLNMVGPEQRGESIWLTEALAYALDTWSEVAGRVGDSIRQQSFSSEADSCREALRSHAWDGRWYRRAFTDAGRVIGGGEQLFLNAQSWALIAGCADRSQSESIIRSVNEMLATPEGPMVLAPAFEGMVEDVGKLTLKTPGTGENGSVYCHAVTFWAYALFMRGYAEEGWAALRSILPRDESETLSRVDQFPIYIPNFFRGEPCGKRAGKSSRSPNTGTAAWYYRAVIEGLFGIRAGWDGLTCDPHLPSGWERASVKREWRGGTYLFNFLRKEGLEKPRLFCRNEEVSGVLPVVEKGKTLEVEVSFS